MTSMTFSVVSIYGVPSAKNTLERKMEIIEIYIGDLLTINNSFPKFTILM